MGQHRTLNNNNDYINISNYHKKLNDVLTTIVLNKSWIWKLGNWSIHDVVQRSYGRCELSLHHCSCPIFGPQLGWVWVAHSHGDWWSNHRGDTKHVPVCSVLQVLQAHFWGMDNSVKVLCLGPVLTASQSSGSQTVNHATTHPLLTPTGAALPTMPHHPHGLYQIWSIYGTRLTTPGIKPGY